jgi:hypothetical protein
MRFSTGTHCSGDRCFFVSRSGTPKEILKRMLCKQLDRIKVIEILDAMCGTGKSYNLFRYVSLYPYERYIYVTPMLSEVASRAAEELSKFGDCRVVFDEPTGEGFRSKGEHLIALLQEGKNVICTHSLFQLMDATARQYISAYGYTLIIDEELGMIEPLDNAVFSQQDRNKLIDQGVLRLEDDGRVVWVDATWGNGDSFFSEARKLADSGSLYADKSGTFFNVQLPVELVSAAKRVIVATYMFEGSVFQAFLKVKGFMHVPFHFEGLELRNERELKHALKERIQFVEMPLTTDKLCRELKIPLHDSKGKTSSTVLSSTWYRNAKGAQIALLGKHIRNIARNMDIRAADLMYTLPSSIAGKKGDKWVKSGAKLIKVKSFSPENCFLQKGARATNDYAHKTAAIHAYNRYPHPAVTRYLEEHGANVDADAFALAEFIQWFFRSAIRVPYGPVVKLHIVSPRMNKLFKDWLDK